MTPGSTDYVTVGGEGGYYSVGGPGCSGGFNGGGNGGQGLLWNDSDQLVQGCQPGGGGGGASDFRTSAGLAGRIIVAGGGGGSGGINAGGGRGGDSASDGSAGGLDCEQAGPPCSVGTGGKAGTSAGANGGTGSSCEGTTAASGSNAAPGSYQGGDGASVLAFPVGYTSFGFPDSTIGGGGGGGGYYGGAGGGGGYDLVSDALCAATSSGGGGGSDHVEPAASGVTITDGNHAGNGLVTITYAEPSTLTVTKHLVSNSADPAKFNLRIDGTTYAANVGNGGTTGAVIVSGGTHTVAETAGANANLGNYTARIACSDGSAGYGTSLSGISVGSPGDHVSCTITNARKLFRAG